MDELKNISFRKARFGGYKPEDVDKFIDDIQTSYEEILRENKHLNLAVEKLEKNLKKFHDEESSIKEVILNLKNMTEKSALDAEIKANEIIEEAKKEVAVQNEISKNLKDESTRLKKCLEDIYKQHLEIIKKIPTFNIL